MKKRILSLLLVMAMLLSVVPMVGATDEEATGGPKFSGRRLLLEESIAIDFQAKYANIADGFEKVEFIMNDEVVQTIKTLPEADAEGDVYFSFTKLTPAQLGNLVTARLWVDGSYTEVETSVLSYCEDALERNNTALKKMVVDLLNYGAATQAYARAEGDTTVSETPVNAGLSASDAALGTPADTNLNLTSATDFFAYDTEVEQYARAEDVQWIGPALNLKDSITLRLQFQTENIDGLKIKFTIGENIYYVDTFEPVEGVANNYSVYFNELNPAQLREELTIIAYYGSRIGSKKLTYSVESYAYSVANGTYSTELTALTSAMMRYGDSVYAYRQTLCNHPTYTDGLCDLCGAERVFVLDAADTTTAIDAIEAVLTLNEGTSTALKKVENSNAVSDAKTVLQMYNLHGDYSTKTSADYPGNIIVHVTPAVSGTYMVQTTGVYKSNTAGVGILVEDDTSTAEQNYKRIAFPAKSTAPEGSELLFSNGSIVTMTVGETYEWTAGETYSIRLVSSSTNAAFDQILITHIHTYDDDADPTCNGCGAVREPSHVCDFGDEWTKDATHHWHECECGEKADKAEHTYTDGICSVCGAEKVFALNADSTIINAKDAVLTWKVNNLTALYSYTNSNSNTDTDTIIRVNTRYSSYTETGDDPQTGLTAPGSIIVYVTPAVSGTYQISARVLCNGNAGATGVLVEDNNTTTGAYYVRQTFDVGTYMSAADWTTSNAFDTKTFDNTYDWTVGQTYAIRILSASNKIGFDQFTITNVTPAE